MVYVGTRVALRCIAPHSSPPVTYDLIGEGGVLINTYTDYEGDQLALFVMKATATLEGSYHCKATAGGRTGVSNTIKLSVVIVYEGSRVVLSCNAKKGTHLSYTWVFNMKELTSSTTPFFNFTGNKLVIGKVTPEHAGSYYCMAWSMVKDIRRISSSTEVQVIVKEGASYRGNVTCWSTRGSPPVNFSLLVDDIEVGSVTVPESLAAWFSVSVVPELDMGMAQCRVNTEVQELMSEPMTLELVPVGGDVKVEVQYLFSAHSLLAAARLRCHISRGTFPYVSWFLNDTILLPETHLDVSIHPIQPTTIQSNYLLADRRRTLIPIKLDPEVSGYYRCRVSNSYDVSGEWVESAAVPVQITGLHISTTEIISITFCCFVLLMLVVGAAIVYKMFDRKQGVSTVFVVFSSSSDAFPPFASMSQSEGQQVDASSTDCGDLNQVYRPSQLISVSQILVVHNYLALQRLWLKKVAEFKCGLQSYPKNESILLQLYKEDNREKKLGEYLFDGNVTTIPMVIRRSHDGNLVCVAKRLNTSATDSNVHYLKVIEPVKGASIDVRSGPVEFFEGRTLELSCSHTAGTYVSYKWLLNGQLVSQAVQYQNRLLIYRTTSKDSGSYMCMAFNEFNKTKFIANSTEVVITVKDLVSRPNISITVLKEDSHNYSAMVTCESTNGTPPVTFSLYNRTELVANMTAKDRNATFKVPLVLGQHMGYLQCQANNGNETKYSKWIPIEVVEGPVMMDYDYNVGERYDVVSLVLYCKAAKGSFPRYQWFLNKTLLDDRGSFYYDLSEYNEDTDVLETAKDAEFDQTSEASVDEWPQIEEEKKTLEDEPAEEP
ncbi:Fc receptor-like protein 3 [Nibea albiflora]|uniref:Fc receptor-like protein 3 n=1 Tax=Nibea albiflora TaxID=240163 RepID=A0ACB7FMV6_NIBAL|nr:Fc receptor-like protein 3 [Nibea albiflora]